MGIWNWLDRAMGLIYEVCHGGIRHWLYQGDGVDLQGRVMGAPGWIGAIESICGGVPWGRTSLAGSGDGIESWGYVTLAGLGRWNCFMGTRDTGWSRAMGLIYGGVWHWLERGDGSDSRVLAMGAHDTGRQGSSANVNPALGTGSGSGLFIIGISKNVI